MKFMKFMKIKQLYKKYYIENPNNLLNYDYVNDTVIMNVDLNNFLSYYLI